MNIPILFEDSNIAAVNKPAGLVVHPDGERDEETLVNWIIKKYPEMENIGEPLVLQDGREIIRPGIVHRLDKETSGVLVLAKNEKTFLHLKRQFQEREIEKIYNAFVYGELKDDKGVIDRAIGRSGSDFRLRSTSKNVRGELREAITYYTVLRRGNNSSFIEVNPRTGRMHQIRVHMKTINHPIVCDKLYAPKRPCELGFRRLALHARTISAKLLSGERIIVEAPFPDDFEDALKMFPDEIA